MKNASRTTGVTILTEENLHRVPAEIQAVFKKVESGELISPKRKKALLESTARRTKVLLETNSRISQKDLIVEVAKHFPEKLPPAFLVELVAEIVKQWQDYQQVELV